MQLRDFYHHRRVQNKKKGSRPRTTGDLGREPAGSTLQKTRGSWRATPAVPGAQIKSTPRTTGPTAVG